MIVFQTEKYKIDLTNRGVSFNEKSDYFTDQISKSFSFPFTVYIYEDIAAQLGLVNIENVKSYKSKINGYLIIDGDFYDAYIYLNSISGKKAELTLYYGKEVLSVFDRELKQLPFPVISTTDLPAFAKAQISKAWPEASHNFIKMFRDEIKNESNYELFENFVNNYVDNNGTWEFPINTTDLINGENVNVNRNVLCPMPYLLEIFKVIFASEGLEIKGDFVNDEFCKKIVYIPENYFENFASSEFENYSLSTNTGQETIDGKVIYKYKRTHLPAALGSYNLKININMSDVVAKYFHLTVKQNFDTLYEAKSENNIVNINQTLNINIVNTTVFDPIEVELRLLQQEVPITNYNNFTYQFKEDQLNVFPTAYTLADFMPDMNVREFINKIKSWLNLKFDYTNNAVYINYLENINDSLIFKTNKHLEISNPTRDLNSNNLFKLSYPDGQEVLVNKNGQTYTALDFVNTEIEEMPMDPQPLAVNSNFDVVTAVYPKEDFDLMFCLYDGLVGHEPLAVDSIDNRKLDLQSIYDFYWKKWLKFRANSETYKDTFFMHVSEKLDKKTGLYKYNKKHLIKSIHKKRVNEHYWKVDLETETF